MDRQIAPNFEIGIHGPPFWSEFLKRDPWTAILVRIFKKDTLTTKLVQNFKKGSMNRQIGPNSEIGINGPPFWSEFSKGMQRAIDR